MKHGKNTWVRAVAPLVLLGSTSAFGATITYNNETYDAGSGFGNVASILSLQAQGNGTTEYGSVLRNAANTADVVSGDAQNQSRTWSIAELASRTKPVNVTKDSFGLVLNLNEKNPEPDITVGGFTLRFYDYATNSTFDATYTGPTVFSETNQGTGSSGFLFHVVFETAAEQAWFNNAANRVGMIVDSTQKFSNVSSGAENFFIAAPPAPTPPPVAVPLPSPVWLGGAGLVGLMIRRRLARA